MALTGGLTLPDWAGIQTDIDDLNSNVRGYTVIDMDSDDYTMSAAESLNTILIISNPGDGTKTLTVSDSVDNPGEYKILIAGGGIISFNSAVVDSPVPVFTKALISYSYGVGQFDFLRRVINNEYVNTACAPNLHNTNQLIHSVYLPPNTLPDNGASLDVYSSWLKDGDDNTYNIGLSFTAANDATLNALYGNASVAATTRMQSIAIRVFRVDATTLAIATIPNSPSAFGSNAATAYTSITVPNMGTAGMYIKFTCRSTTTTSATEVITLQKATVEYSGV